MSADRRAVKRATLHVDVGAELSALIRAKAAACGRTPSEWTRELLQRELARENASTTASRHLISSSSNAAAAAPSRLVLDSELSTLLRDIQAQGQFRTRPAALRLVLRQFLGRMPALPTNAVDTAPLKDAVAALMRSNHELTSIAKDINRIAKSMGAVQGDDPDSSPLELLFLARAAREHVARSARVAALVRALVTPRKDTP